METVTVDASKILLDDLILNSFSQHERGIVSEIETDTTTGNVVITTECFTMTVSPVHPVIVFNRQPETTLSIKVPLQYLITKDWGNPDDCPIAATLKDMGFSASVGFFYVYFYSQEPNHGKRSRLLGEIGIVDNLSYLHHFAELLDETGNPEDCPAFIDIDISVNPVVLTSIYRSN